MVTVGLTDVAERVIRCCVSAAALVGSARDGLRCLCCVEWAVRAAARSCTGEEDLNSIERQLPPMTGASACFSISVRDRPLLCKFECSHVKSFPRASTFSRDVD